MSTSGPSVDFGGAWRWLVRPDFGSAERPSGSAVDKYGIIASDAPQSPRPATPQPVPETDA